LKAVEDFVSDSFSIVLRRDYLELIESMAAGVEGKVVRCAAALVAYYRHWQEWKQERQRTDWLYQPLRQLYKDLMGLFSIPVIRAANDLLINLGLLERRGNPGNKQDKTYQYNVRFDRFQQLLAKTSAASSFEKTDVSAAIPNFSASPANTHHNIQSDKVTSSNQNVIEGEESDSNQEGSASIIQVEMLTATEERDEIRRLIADSLDEAQSSALASLDIDGVMQEAESTDNSAVLKVAEEFLGNLNTEAERKKRSRSDRIPRPLCIPGLDSEAHEILWKHQAQLEKLNADLHAERIQKAIADNPQYLESAILAFIENSAQGAKTPLAATGFLLNALRQGWKPRQSKSSEAASVQVYTPPSQMLEEPLPSTLEELVERKRHLWKYAPIMRQSIRVWAEQTPGVIMGEDGPELAVPQALSTQPTEPAVTPAKEPAAPHQKPAPTLPEASTKSLAEPAELVTTPVPPEANALTPALTPVAPPMADSPATTKVPAAADPTVSRRRPAASLALSSGPVKPPAASVPSSTDEPLKVGERVLWNNCPAHCASWNPFTISKIIGGKVWLDVYEKPVPLSELKRAP